MLVSLFGACGLRLIWVFFFLPLQRTLPFLYISYPLSWGVTFAVAAGLFLYLTTPKQIAAIMDKAAATAETQPLQVTEEPEALNVER